MQITTENALLELDLIATAKLLLKIFNQLMWSNLLSEPTSYSATTVRTAAAARTAAAIRINATVRKAGSAVR